MKNILEVIETPVLNKREWDVDIWQNNGFDVLCLSKENKEFIVYCHNTWYKSKSGLMVDINAALDEIENN